MNGLVGLLAFIAGVVMVTIAFSTPGNQLALSFLGGALIGFGFVLVAGLFR